MKFKARMQERPVKSMTKSKDMRTSKRYAMTSYLQNVNVLNLINSVQSCEEKTSVLEDNIRFSLDAIMPLE